MKNLIGNNWCAASTNEVIEIVNPYNNAVIDTVPNSSLDDVNEAVKVSYESLKYWAGLSIDERCQIMLKFNELIEKESYELAKLLTSETGKNICDSQDEIDNLMSLVVAFVEKARHMYCNVIPNGLDSYNESTIQITSREPFGVIAAILPFNFPVMTFAQKVVPALIMGNTVIVKPSTKAPLTITKLVYLLRVAGVPKGVVQVIHGVGKKVGYALAIHPDLQLIAFSGSTVNGMQVMEAASRNLTRVLLELSDNAAMIVCEDADVDLAIDEAVRGRLYNMGQGANSTKRFLVHSSKKGAFVSGLIKKISSMKYGNPFDSSNDLSCLIDENAAIKVDERVHKLVDQGASIIFGGNRKGNYYEPTILLGVTEEMNITSNVEILGPLFPIIEYTDINKAIEIVNNSPYGLVSSIFTKNIGTAFKLARCLRTGTVVINGNTQYRSNELTYGGWKYSSFGTESISSALEQFSLVKTIVLKNVLE